MATYSPIAIIGAGPSGLTLARLLEINNIDYMVYERDESPEPKFINQGGTLDIHASSGQVALKEARLFDEFKSIARWDASRVFMQNPSGTVTAVFGDERDAPEIDRLQLRKLLLDSIPTDKIRWGHRVKSIERGDTASEHVISFVNSASASGFRAIVGADGAWSKVRPLLTSAKPEYSGKVFIEGSISHNNPSYTAALEHAGPGNMLAMGQHKIMAIQQLSDRSYRFYMGMDAPEELYRRPLGHEDTEDIRQKFLSSPEFFANWAPNLKEYLANAEGPFHAWPLYRLPVSSVGWKRVPGPTLLGDAAHLATPLVGEGVNMAMLDALMLAKAIVKYCKQAGGADIEEGQLENALKEYEREMFVRGQDYIRRCMAREVEFFSENTAEDFINMINGAVDDGQEDAR
ncbi:related to tetracycline resistance protein from transposon Tn4351/Tn4400 [Fusarium oxysporum]|uniref:Related to tetracycline resistance protein from transposon Tn4351/Tn4400 n=1 Tax=Fusarium oxysporum TaxID=5507 RepID=A0A2H3T615_FUSOX|nr:related to tetracycline resistance protein from transposon Tn4351/Tn4400 [Fusarium oxysporum]